MIRVDAVWLAVEPLDMRAGTEAALARVVNAFGAARPHRAYLFANRRANRMKVLVHDGIGVWLAARRLNVGKFVRSQDGASTLTLTRAQLGALALGLPWQRLGARAETLDYQPGVFTVDFKTCWIACQRTRPAGSTSSCRIAGHQPRW